jgi:metallo-beta-lactamase family protein
MGGLNEEYPWLPSDPGPDFDPLAHAEVEPSKDRPFVIVPRGGAREVGRSCYQVETEHATYLVDCGLNQGTGPQYPDFRGLSRGQVDGVFLTHAHIDHSGGLPVLEAEGYLSDDAPIVTTKPTAALAGLLLEDALSIHRQEVADQGIPQRFTEQHLTAVRDRLHPIEYGGGLAAGVTDAPDTDATVFRFGDAAHLLGSAWLSLQAHGTKVVFSGDLGGRAPHLRDIEAPPEATTLILESTYGATHTHPSMDDSRTALFELIRNAVEERKPVLIPTFAVGRAQLILGDLNNRLHQLGESLHDRIEIVVDGLAQDATDHYHGFVDDDEWVADAIVNRVTESGDAEPFLPAKVTQPSGDPDRRDCLQGAPDTVPIIVSPSGMLTGGNSPRYLAELAARGDDARVILTGYQAVGTIGRTIQSQYNADNEEITVEMDVEPFGIEWPDSDTLTRTVLDDGQRGVRVQFPASWIEEASGLSGHASQYGLREFARRVAPESVGLIHGPEFAQQGLAEDLVTNVESVAKATRTGLLSPLPVEADAEFELPSLSSEAMGSGDDISVTERVAELSEQVALLNERLAQLEDEAVRAEEVQPLLDSDRTELGEETLSDDPE